MNLYLIYRKGSVDYDEYDSAVVCAKSAEDAITIHPDVQGNPVTNEPDEDMVYSSWVFKKDVAVDYLGIASKELDRGVIIASFNAG